MTTFDTVDYEVHVAVFDAEGKPLGTAAAVCPVERLWLGKVGQATKTLRLDFSVSTAWKRGAWFTVGITERPVLTPDDWMERPEER